MARDKFLSHWGNREGSALYVSLSLKDEPPQLPAHRPQHLRGPSLTWLVMVNAGVAEARGALAPDKGAGRVRRRQAKYWWVSRISQVFGLSRSQGWTGDWNAARTSPELTSHLAFLLLVSSYFLLGCWLLFTMMCLTFSFFSFPVFWPPICVTYLSTLSSNTAGTSTAWLFCASDFWCLAGSRCSAIYKRWGERNKKGWGGRKGEKNEVRKCPRAVFIAIKKYLCLGHLWRKEV